MASVRCLAALQRYCSVQTLILPQNLTVLVAADHMAKKLSLLSSSLGTLMPQAQTRLEFVRQIHSSLLLGAGHSKWHNIRHIKAAVDKEKGEKSNLLARKLRSVLERNSSTDPKLNPELANLIKWARSNSLTNDVIGNTIEKQVKLRDPKHLMSFSGRGPSNTALVIECFTMNPTHTKGILQGLVKKYGFNLHAPADDLFDHKGIIDIELPSEEVSAARANPEKFSLDKYIELAIETGAEDVKLETDDDEQPYLQFLCGPHDVAKVSKQMSSAGMNIRNSEKAYIPKLVVPVTQEFMENLVKLIDKLDINPDVISYHFNVDPPS